MKKVVISISVFVFVIFSFAGCQWVGRTSGKAEKGIQTGAEKVEKSVDKMQDDTKKGYEEGKK